MKVVIQAAEADDAQAWAMLQCHSPGVALPNRTFVVSDQAVERGCVWRLSPWMVRRARSTFWRTRAILVH